MESQVRSNNRCITWCKRSLQMRRKVHGNSVSEKQELTGPRNYMRASKQEKMREAFNFFDTDNNGKISASELRMVLERTREDASDEAVERIMQELDKDGDGELSFEEFMLSDPFPKGFHQNLMEAFSKFDMNQDGLISSQELQMVMQNLGLNVSLDDCRQMIWHVDNDGDGHVNFEEFQLMMMS
ncbi:hypothetical protein KP509_15G070300 [Ceratopteris richardii]|uniref:EF-hand domain-containing protein n=1 Tax=Ceratopteris richardii TaxID=49495 RepID=A0A8T2T945_CERRI|nr:hypothetical protein KP509_15G070300 [Ceratopteris richardii]